MPRTSRAAETADLFTSTDPADIAEGDRRIYALLDDGVRQDMVDIRLNCAPKRVQDAIARRPPQALANPNVTEPWQLDIMEPTKPKTKPLPDPVWSPEPLSAGAKPAPDLGPLRPDAPVVQREVIIIPHERTKRRYRRKIKVDDGAPIDMLELERDAPATTQPVPAGVANPDSTQTMIKLVVYNAEMEFSTKLDAIRTKDPKNVRARNIRYAILLVLKAVGVEPEAAGPALERDAAMARYLYSCAKSNMEKTKGANCRMFALNLARRLGVHSSQL